MKPMKSLASVAFGLLVMGGTGLLNAAPSAEVIPFWNAADDTNTSSFDHSPWQEILDQYLVADHPSGIARFDYGALKANEDDKRKLIAYLLDLTRKDPREYRRKEQFGYWVNLYNALTVNVIVGRYPVESIRDIRSGLITPGPWEKELVTIAGVKVTLDHIEHGILRPIWRDPRIHYAVNCASLGCPNLAATAFDAENSEQLLHQAAVAYVNHPRGAHVADGTLTVSSIYDWFKEDFGGTDEGVLAHLTQYASEEFAAQLEGFTEFDDDYDWALNEP